MRYQSFYPFAQSQMPNVAPRHSMPQSFSGGNPSQMPFGGLENAFGNANPSQSPFGGLGNAFGNGNANPPQTPFGGLGNALGNGGSPQGTNRVEQFMETADRFLNTAQKLTPMVQQVAPMVQNIPALWRMYRGFQNMPDATATASAVRNVASAAPRVGGISQPRIFQPPF